MEDKAPLGWGFIELIWMFLSRTFEDSGPDFQALGLGSKQMVVLAIIQTHPSPGKLREALGAPPSTISNLLNDLEGKGLVERRIHPSDKRQYQLALTEIGQSKLAEGSAIIDAKLRSAALSLSAHEREAFQTVSATLKQLLES